MSTRRYSIPVHAVDSAGAALNSLVWAARNTSTRMVHVCALYLSAGFNGTAAASSSIYNLIRFRTATPSGGAALTPILLSGAGTVGIGDARVDEAGLTVTSVTFDTPWAQVGHPRQHGAVPYYQHNVALELPTGDGLGIRLGALAVAGDSITGWVTFEEYSI